MLTNSPAITPIRGVIFDFHTTLFEVRDPATWLSAARRHLGDHAEQPGDDALIAHLDRIWEHAAPLDPDNSRDLSSQRHRAVFLLAMGLLSDVDPSLIEALYATMVDQYVPFDDTFPVLAELKAYGVRIVVLSNTGRDIRQCFDRTGLTDLIDGMVLSYELGVVKPQLKIFAHALELLEVPAEEALMVGDNWRDDGGAAALGIRTLILPRTRGHTHGLGAVLRLV